MPNGHEPRSPGFGALRRRDLVVPAMAVAAFLVLHLIGREARTFLHDRAVVRCASPADVLIEWRRAGVKGRTLVHLARSIAVSFEPGPLSAENWVWRAVDENVVRRIYHVVPDDAWAEVAERLRVFPEAHFTGGRFRLAVLGTPIVVTRLSDLPSIEEPVLVDVEVDRWNEAELAVIAQRLSRGAPSADLVAWYGSAPPRAFETLRAAE